jgi:hypothetical protein
VYLSSQQPIPKEQQGGQGSSASGQAQSLPDINAEINPFETVLQMLNRSADLELFLNAGQKQPTATDPNEPFTATGAFGINIDGDLHPFVSTFQLSTKSGRPGVVQAVGESVGNLRGRWMVCPDNCPWTPGRDPNPVLLDPTRSQPFSMLDMVFTFGDATDSFRGYGHGRTFPIIVNGRPELQAGGMGNVTDGSGKFKGLEGTFAFTGTVTRDYGLLGAITCRFLDWEGVLRTESDISMSFSGGDSDPHATYIALRGEKKDRLQKSAYLFGPDGKPQGLLTPAEFRTVQYNVAEHRYRDRSFRTNHTVGPVVAKLEANIIADIISPPGTPSAPAPFSTQELYTFFGSDGQTIGTITAGVVLGYSFGLTFPALPGQPGLRFAGFGPIQEGTGAFAGVQGMLTVNSLIGISPHALALMHVFRIIDPNRTFRAGVRA